LGELRGVRLHGGLLRAIHAALQGLLDPVVRRPPRLLGGHVARHNIALPVQNRPVSKVVFGLFEDLTQVLKEDVDEDNNSFK
jgi:hypothetical protein